MISSLLSLFAAAATASSVNATPIAPNKDVHLDFFLVQDLSSSYNNDLPNLVEQIPNVITGLAQRYPNSRFGFGSFVDKPIADFGYSVSGDYCYKQHMPLYDLEVKVDDYGNATGSVDSKGEHFNLDDVLNGLTVHSGKDWKENQLGALLHAIVSRNTGWVRGDEPNRVNIVALATDAGFHQAGDGVSHDLIRTIGAYKNEPDEWCLTEDYPSLTDIEMALDTYNTKLLLLVTSDMVNYYKRFLKAIGEDRGVVVALDDKSEFIAQAIASGIEYMEGGASGFGLAANKALSGLIKEEEDHMTEEELLNKHAASKLPKAAKAMPLAKNSSLRTAGDMYSHVKSLKTLAPDHNEILSMCHPDTVFEVMLVQDASDSYATEIQSISKQVQNTWSKVVTKYPGSNIGLVSFVDKPIEPYGYSESGDYCASLRVPLSGDASKVADSYDKLVVRSGADWKEAQLHGMLHSVYTQSAGWNQNPFDVNDKRIVRVAITITDAGYHVSGDSNLRPNNGDRELDCVGEDYPSTSQVAAAFKRQLVFPAFLVTEDVQNEYEDLLHNKLKLNGTVIPIDTATSRVGNLESGLLLTLASVCNQSAITANSGGHQAVTEETEDGVRIHLAQMPKYLAVVAKN